jgi:D-3-phosphoglycerate dehydrogenase / 2-oxoglutarate reductase
VLGFDPAISVEAAWRLSSEVGKMENLPSLLSRSDFVSLHVPALEVTHHLINQEALKAAKPGLRLLNFAREEVVDTAAAIVALDTGKLAAYASDFPTPELIGRDDVFLTPHIGASTDEAEENCAVMAAEQLREFLENGNIVNSVNFPFASMERTSGNRITFSNENVAGVLGQVLSVLARHGVNVIDMLNRSREDLAYNILDVAGDISAQIVADISAVEHVIKVRLI